MHTLSKGLLAVLMLCGPAVVAAQSAPPVKRAGWEAFRNVEFLGGDPGLTAGRKGALVLTDSTIEFRECALPQCEDVGPARPWFAAQPLLRIELWNIVKIDNASQVRANDPLTPSLAKDMTEETVSITYETATSAEAPVFKTQRAESAALVAKLNFRLKKLLFPLDSIFRRRG